MEYKKTDSGNTEDIVDIPADLPVVFPAIPWLRDGTDYDVYLESAIAHAKNQDAEATLLPVHLTETIEDYINITKENQMELITPKLNEIIDACPKEATHVWFLNADNEVPTFALRYLLEHDADVASGISSTHSSSTMTTAMHWAPAPTRQLMGSQPYFKPYRLQSIMNRVVGGGRMVASGHFCMLVKKEVFNNVWFRWMPYKSRRCSCGETVKCLRQQYGSEYTFWLDCQMLGYRCVIDGRVICGHLPQWPLTLYSK